MTKQGGLAMIFTTQIRLTHPFKHLVIITFSPVTLQIGIFPIKCWCSRGNFHWNDWTLLFTFAIKMTIQWNFFILDSVLDFARDKKRFQKKFYLKVPFSVRFVLENEKKKLLPRLKDKVHTVYVNSFEVIKTDFMWPYWVDRITYITSSPLLLYYVNRYRDKSVWIGRVSFAKDR